MFNIIEDCSPYYVKFSHPCLSEVVDYINNINYQITEDWKSNIGILGRFQFSTEHSISILEKLPMKNILPKFDLDRVSVWRTPAGGFRNAHKDGLQNGCAINIPVSILDDLCRTSWYTDDELQDCTIENKAMNFKGKRGGYREAIGFSFDKHKPIASTVMSKNVMMLFNSNIWHSVDNRHSSNDRSIITLRFEDSENLTYDQIFNTLFAKI